ncbi:tetratricopeptide repeat protein [Plantactinospora solaniradicis]|uniref:Tetratricopeptide repeat protein n=1 Tax=Plantactinospora solaniradicis TaxID=1723736 RepID=A0ABW1KK65_9ACTN
MTSEEIDAGYGRADHLCELGRWTDAERALGIVLGADPDHPQALARLTEVLENLDRPEEAAEVAERLIEAHPEDPTGYLALAEALVRQDEHAEAEPHVRAALDLDPSAPVAWQQLAEVLSYLPERGDEAVAAARRAVTLAPEDADMHATLGDALLTAFGDGPAAEAGYLTALALAPEDGGIRLRLGLARLQIGRLDDARDDFVEGLRREASLRHVSTVGMTLRLLGVPDRYAELYASVCAAMGEPATVDRTDPEVIEDQLDMAVCWWDNGARAAALEVLELLVDANPYSVEGLATLAEYRFESGRLDDAQVLAERALAVDPDAPAALFVLGLVCEARGDGAGAADWFERLRALPVDAEDRDWMMESLVNHGMAGRHPEMILWYEETATTGAAAAPEPVAAPVPPPLPTGALVRPAIDGEPTGRLAAIKAKLEVLKRLEAEHGFGVVVEEPATLERIPELPYGVVEVFSLFRRVEGTCLRIEQPVEINSRTAWITRRRDPHDPLGNPLAIGRVRRPTRFSDVEFEDGSPILLDVEDGRVFAVEPDDYVFFYEHPAEDVEIGYLGTDAVAFCDDYLLGEMYPQFVKNIIGVDVGTERIRKGPHKGELADTWMRLLVSAGLAS